MPIILAGSSSIPSSVVTTVAESEIVSRIRVLLNDEPWEDTLSSSQGSGDTTINFTNPTKWGPSDIIDFGYTDGEQQRIKPATTPLSNPIAIKRSHNGTTAVAHFSGDTVLKNPRYSYREIIRGIEAILPQTEGFMWTVTSATITPAPTSTRDYTISDANFRRFVSAVQESTATITEVLTYPPLKILKNIPTGVSSTGLAVRFPFFWNLTNDVTLTYFAKITTSTIPEGEIAEAIVIKAAAYIMRMKMLMLRNQDTTAQNQSTSTRGGAESAIAAEIAGFDRQFIEAQYAIRLHMEAQYGPPDEWNSFEWEPSNAWQGSRMSGIW